MPGLTLSPAKHGHRLVSGTPCHSRCSWPRCALPGLPKGSEHESFWSLAGRALVSCGCCKEGPPAGWPEITQVNSLAVSRCEQGRAPSGASGGGSSWGCVTLGAPWWVAASLPSPPLPSQSVLCPGGPLTMRTRVPGLRSPSPSTASPAETGSWNRATCTGSRRRALGM